MITALASNQAGARSLAPQAVVGDRGLESSIGGFRARVGEEQPIKIAGKDGAGPSRRPECAGVSHLKSRYIVQACDLVAHGLYDFGMGVAGIATPEPGGSIEDFATVMRRVVHALRRHEQARRSLKLSIGGERHPVGFDVVARYGIVHSPSFREPIAPGTLLGKRNAASQYGVQAPRVLGDQDSNWKRVA